METADKIMRALRTFLTPGEPKTVSLLFVGETGAGKSTFINYLANFLLGGRLGGLKVLIPTAKRVVNVKGAESHAEGNLHDSSKSMTTTCTEYRFVNGNTTLVLIDTPGLSDTSGIEADEQNINEILEAACKQMSINAVVLLINGTASRITVNIQTAITRIMGNYPSAFSNNLVVILTNCSENVSNFPIKMLPIKPRKVFHVNNMAFMEDLEDAEPEYVGASWKGSMNMIERFVAFVSELPAIGTWKFVELKQLRGEIIAETHLCVEKIKDLEKQLNALEETKRMKQKSDRLPANARQDAKELVLKMTRHDEEIKNCNQEIEAMIANICGLCDEMKKVCRCFDYVEELQCEIRALKANQRTLTDTESVQKAEALINHLSEVANRIMKR